MSRRRCQCCGGNLIIYGCNSLPLVGATVDVYAGGGGVPLIATGTTDAAGNSGINLSAGVSYDVRITLARFSTARQTVTGPTSGNLTVAAPVDTANYHCGPLTCVLPIANTLHVTDSCTGHSFTVAWLSGRVWQGTDPATYTAYAGSRCPAPAASGPVNIIYRIDFATQTAQITYPCDGTHNPTPTGFFTCVQTNVFQPNSLTCFPFSCTLQFDNGPGAGSTRYVSTSIYCQCANPAGGIPAGPYVFLTTTE
jgi:hypothetical protein